MPWYQTLLWPIMVPVAWIMVWIHDGLLWLGMPESSSWAWILSIVGLTVVIRIILIPLFFRQIKASRGMQMLQPDMQKIQKKYKGKTDPASRQAMQQEMMALYQKHGTNPFSSCLPILAQTPIFFALFQVLYSLRPIADGTREAIGPINQEIAQQIEGSRLFGAALSDWFLMPDATTATRIVSVVLIVLMSVTTFTTQRQLTMKNMPAASLDNPMARQQRMLMYVLPLIFAISGVNFPIGVLMYWLTTNLWSMGQQFYTIRRMPAPGSEAARKFEERQQRKRARRGLPPAAEEKEPEQPAGPRGQRQQPVRKDRQKKGPVREPFAAGAQPGVPEDERGGDGLTAAERAQRRYDERAAQRRANQAKSGPPRKKRTGGRSTQGKSRKS